MFPIMGNSCRIYVINCRILQTHETLFEPYAHLATQVESIARAVELLPAEDLEWLVTGRAL